MICQVNAITRTAASNAATSAKATYSQIPNWLLECLPLYDFNASQVDLLLVLARMIYGYHRDEVDISRSFIAAKAGMDESQCRQTLKELVAGHVITRDIGRIGHIFSINTQDCWNVPLKALVKSVPVPTFFSIENEQSGPSLQGTWGGSHVPPRGGEPRSPIKQNLDKKETTPANTLKGDVAEPSKAVVVLSPSALEATAKAAITQEAPQAAHYTQQPIGQPTQTTAPTTRLAPTVAICNAATVPAVKPAVPARVEAIKQPPAPKPEPVNPPSFHHSLTRAESATIMTLLVVLPTDIQAIVLAELTAQLDGGGIHRPVGYARRLVEVAKAGTFVPSASREAMQRAEVAAQEAARKRKQAEEEQAQADANATEAAKLDSILEGVKPERLADMRAEFIRGLPKFQRKLFESTCYDSPGFSALFRGHLREKLNI